MSYLNRLANVKNPYQGNYKKVLCVCSAGLLRSPTVAYVLSQDPYGYNTRSAGINNEYALIPVDDALVAWADEIVCMDRIQVDSIKSAYKPIAKVINLKIPDQFEYRQPELIELIKVNYDKYLNGELDS